MKFLTDEQIKAQLTLDADIWQEKADIIRLWAESAEDTVIENCNRTFEDIIEEYGRVPPKLIHAALLLTAQSYHIGEPISDRNLYMVPYQNLEALTRFYRKL